MTENTASVPSSLRALQDALATVPPDVRPPRPLEDPAAAESTGAPSQGEPRRADDEVLRNINSLGAVMSDRLDAVERRLAELTVAVEVLLSALSDPPPGEGPHHSTYPGALAAPNSAEVLRSSYDGPGFG